MNEEQFKAAFYEHDIILSSRQLEQFNLYYKMLVEWNEKVNLTAITKREEVYIKHFYDSITPMFYFPFESNMIICDIGAGAGFPSLPLLIMMPELQVTIVDALKKRIHFLEALTEKLELNNVELIHGRAEDIGKDKTYREQFSVVTARAVANLAVLSELCLPLCSLGGTFIALKGDHAEEELTQSQHAYTILGGGNMQSKIFDLPVGAGERTIITIDKIKNTPNKYPRKAGLPSKKPL